MVLERGLAMTSSPPGSLNLMSGKNQLNNFLKAAAN